MIAHAAGIPVEETLLPLLSGVSAGLLLARAWVVSRVRHPRSPRHARPQNADAGLTAAEATEVLADDGLDARPHRQMHTTRPGG
jgi:hypothetical protein